MQPQNNKDVAGWRLAVVGALRRWLEMTWAYRTPATNTAREKPGLESNNFPEQALQGDFAVAN